MPWILDDLPLQKALNNRANRFIDNIVIQDPANLVFEGLGEATDPVFAPRVAQFAPLIMAAASKYNVPAQIIGNIIQAESAGDPRAYRGYGENSRGLMQLTEATARDMKFTGDFDLLYDPATNIDMGVRLLSIYRDMEWPLFSADTSLIDRWKVIASGYNQGPDYGINALKQLSAMGKSTNWDNVLSYMISNPLPAGYAKAGKVPIAKYASSYGPKAVGELTDSDIFTPGRIGFIAIIAMMGAGYFMVKYLRKKGHLQGFQLAQNPKSKYFIK